MHRNDSILRSVVLGMGVALFSASLGVGAEPSPVPRNRDALFARENLVAWCIVPFDAKRRGPAERVEMLKRLGFTRYAYDWRAEHLPTFEQELQLLQAAGIRLEGVWFPATLSPQARLILDLLRKHQIETTLWVMLTDPAPNSQAESDKVAAAVAALRPLAEAARKADCRLGLYNHGHWFGEPENQLAILAALDLPNVGLVYNLHHGHDHLDRFSSLLARMLPHLYALNLNGMTPGGDQDDRKILPLGAGEMDLSLLRTIRDSGYRGPIGILGHTQDDAEERLCDNLDGLDWLAAQLGGDAPGPKPKYRTLSGEARSATPAPSPKERSVQE